MAIRLVVDSASDISKEEAKEMGITMIPILINFDGEEYYDGVDLMPGQFYEKLIESDTLPKTSQITPYRFEECFRELTEGGDEVIAITLSSKLSGTYLAAKQASELFLGKVYVLDSLSAAVGERLLCLVALDMIKKQCTVTEIFLQLNELKHKLHVMAMLNTLEYLKKGGRISSAVAFVGGVLSIKPVVALVDGEVKLVGKAMGSKKANNLLNSLVEKSGGIDFNLPLGVIWSGTERTMLEKYVRDSSYLWADHVEDIPQHMIGSTIGTHVGPGAIGVAFFGKE